MSLTGIDLSDFEERRRGREWARALPALFPFVRFVDAPARPQFGSIRGASFALGQMWRMHIPAQLLRSVAANGNRDNLFSIILQQEGVVQLRQEAQDCRLEPGAFGLIDGNRDFEIESATGSRHILLQIPRSVVAGRFPHLLHKVGRTFSTEGGGGGLLRTLVVQTAMTMDRLSAAEQAAALSSILTLLDVAVSPQGADRRVEAALGLIESDFRDPELSAALIAASQGVSRRRLDELFKQTLGEPVSARIWTRRLQEAADQLLIHDGRSITELALSLGFEDSAHFARAFRRRYGASPTQWRGGRH